MYGKVTIVDSAKKDTAAVTIGNKYTFNCQYSYARDAAIIQHVLRHGEIKLVAATRLSGMRVDCSGVKDVTGKLMCVDCDELFVEN